MSTPRTQSLRHLVPGGLLAGLALTGTALSLGAPHLTRHSASAPLGRTIAQAVSAPAIVAPASASPRRPGARASRGLARTARPIGYVSRTEPAGRTQSGMASWYGPSFQGHRTASGERFDTNDLTAASKTLAFGTRLRVCRGSRCVVVRINDRGPYVAGRILDLSRAARDELGSFGVARVTATPVRTRRVRVSLKPVPHRPLRVAPVVAAPTAVLAAASAPEPRRTGAADAMLAGGLLLAGGSGATWMRRRS